MSRREILEVHGFRNPLNHQKLQLIKVFVACRSKHQQNNKCNLLCAIALERSEAGTINNLKVKSSLHAYAVTMI